VERPLNTSEPSSKNGHNGTAAQAFSSWETRRVKYLMLAIVLVAGFAELAYVVVNISAMPVYVSALGLSKAWIGAMTVVYLLMEGLLKSPFGVLGDRVGRKILIMAGPTISIFTSVLTPFIHNPWLLLFLRVLDGMGAAALWPAAFSLIGDSVPAEKRATAMSQFNLAYLFGLAVGPALGGIINDAARHLLHLPEVISKQASFYAASILFALTVALAVIFIPGGKPKPHDPATEDAEALMAETGFDLKDFGLMLKRMPATLILSLTTFLSVGLIMAYVKIFVLSKFPGMSESEFGLTLIGPAVLIGILSVYLGRLTDKLGKVKAVRVGLCLCAVSFWGLLLLPSRGSLIGFGSLVGLGFVIAFPAWMALVSESAVPQMRGAAVGAVGTAQGLGAILGAAASTFLYPLPAFKLGSLTIPEHSLPFIGCGVMLVVSAILAITTVREHAPVSE
jgi:MFS transporter, DHA1 family, multidrug resistance protein